MRNYPNGVPPSSDRKGTPCTQITGANKVNITPKDPALSVGTKEQSPGRQTAASLGDKTEPRFEVS